MVHFHPGPKHLLPGGTVCATSGPLLFGNAQEHHQSNYHAHDAKAAQGESDDKSQVQVTWTILLSTNSDIRIFFLKALKVNAQADCSEPGKLERNIQ